MTVAIVDDDPEDRNIFCTVLLEQQPPANCIELDSAQQLHLYLSDVVELPDFIFIDLHMPKVTGIECIFDLRNNPKYNDVQIVAYSTLISPVQKAHLENMNVKFILKPASYGDLARRLQEVLQTP